MNKIFIDIGGHRGQTIDQFYAEVADASSWKIYSFEPLKFDLLVKNVDKYSNVICINAAVGRSSGVVKVYPSMKGNGLGSTTLWGKVTGGVAYNKGVDTKEIDFVRWFNNTVQDGDFVVLKMNIEGGEYILMPDLVKILPKLAGLYIMLHHNKFKKELQPEMLETFERFKLEVFKYKTVVFFCFDGKYKFDEMLSKIECQQKLGLYE